MSKPLVCPQCGHQLKKYHNPTPTVDTIIEYPINDNMEGVVLIQRKNPPHGWALPGGFVDYGESLEVAAIREAKEETSLDVALIKQFHSYSAPGRDPRQHTISTVFIARVTGGTLKPADDAVQAIIASRDNLPAEIAFDHRQILEDYFQGRY